MKKPNKRKKYTWKDTEARKAARKRGKETIHAIRLTPVTLRMRHYVNGIAYGPGDLKLPNDLARSLLHAEGHADVIEQQFHGSRGLIIGPKGKVHPVPVETFDNSLVQRMSDPNGEVAITVDGSRYKPSGPQEGGTF